ncbi:MAG: aminoacyltransferase, partial [Bacteroidia bacterium]|nr:aminoacyltransferase [Bacteroidia bacterium]
AGSLFVTTNNIVQYHLSGTRFEFSHLTPTKLLIDEMRIEATERGLQFYNLGGGIGGNSKDSLFRFKSSFSKDFKDFNTWNLIVNQTVYNDLVKKQGKIETSFFPEYRSNVNNLVARAD